MKTENYVDLRPVQLSMKAATIGPFQILLTRNGPHRVAQFLFKVGTALKYPVFKNPREGAQKALLFPDASRQFLFSNGAVVNPHVKPREIFQ